MRVLFISHRFPYPPRFGSQIRTFNTIRHLSRTHEVTVAAPVRSREEEDIAQGLAPHCHEILSFRVHDAAQAAKMVATLPTPISASEAYFHSWPMQRAVRQRVREGRFDMIYVHCSSVGRLVEHESGPLKVIDLCDVDSQKLVDYATQRPWPLSWGYRWEAARLGAAERRLTRNFDYATLATPGELRLLRSIGAVGNADWFPQGVDVDYFSPPQAGYDPLLITFVGRMDYFPNEQAMVDFCDEVWPRLRGLQPRLRLQIVGAMPSARVRRLANLDGVVVTGVVDDVRPFVSDSALTIAPFKIARGTQTKILESMALGVPVVASTVAAGGVDAVADEHLLAAATPDDYVAAISKILGDPAERTRLAVAGRERVVARHSWPSAMRRLDGIIEACRQEHRQRMQIGADLGAAHGG